MQKIEKPLIDAFFDQATNTISYLVSDPETKAAAIIDSVLDYDHRSGRVGTVAADHLLAAVKAGGLDVQWILETHAHADHLSAAPYLKERTGAKIGIGEHISEVQRIFGPVFNLSNVSGNGSEFDGLFKDGERIALGNLEIEVMHTPGHTPACVSYRIGDAVFVGDTLFMPDYGTARTDFPGGSAAQLYQSIQRLLSLPPETRIFVCHDYKAPGRDEFAWETTVAAETLENVHLKGGTSEEQYVKMRNDRDATLAAPVLLLPSIQVNMRAGKLPQAESNGVSYLKIPLQLT